MSALFLARPDGVKLAYAYGAGKSPTLVFLPGFMSDMSGEKAVYLARRAAELGYAQLRLDYSGHGQSGGAFANGCIGVWLADALTIIDAVTQGPLVIVGSSMGGWIAFLAALARKDRVAGLVGIAAAPDFTEDLVWARLSAEQRAQLMAGEVRLPSAYGGDQVFTRRLIEDGREHLLLRRPIGLNCPVRLVQGQCDQDVPWQTSLRIAEKLETADVQLTLLKDGGHRLSRPADLALLGAVLVGALGG